jgi:non-ribosomal peptide synthetase component F
MNTQSLTPNVRQLFERQAERAPNALAVACSHGQLTYRQLNERADELATRLRALGVGPEILVGLCVPRSPAMLVGALGILKAGGAYLPLDPCEPETRLNFMFNDAGVSVVVTESSLKEKMSSGERRVLAINEMGCLAQCNNAGQGQDQNLASNATVDGNSLAYVIYTSGSTGTPKGVEITHQSLSILCHGIKTPLR